MMEPTVNPEGNESINKENEECDDSSTGSGVVESRYSGYFKKFLVLLK